MSAAVFATALVMSQRDQSYEATAKLVINPLAQYDVTFLGTSLIRDAGDANRTPATVADTIDSGAIAAETGRRMGGGYTASRVRDDVDVKPADNRNVVEIKARAGDRALAERLAGTYAQATFDVRWRTIDKELAARIAAFQDRRRAAPDSADVGRERVLRSVRRGGTDPTLKLQGIDPAVSANSLPAGVIVALALLGGLLLGGLTAFLMGGLGRAVQSEEDVLAVYPLPVLARVTEREASQDGFDQIAVQVEAWAPRGGTIAVAGPAGGGGRAAVAAGITAAIAEGGRTATVAQLAPVPSPAGNNAARRPVQQVMSEAGRRAEFVAVDGPPLDEDASALRAAALADIVVLVVQLGQTGRRELTRTRDLLEQTGITPAGLVLVAAGGKDANGECAEH
jgi:capsular polysaccharide biosynthesis protein